MRVLIVLLFAVLAILANGHGIELTFQLPAHSHQCFYEELKAGVESVVEAQVICLILILLLFS